jgi:large subunit ribosomal protein L21
MYAIVDIAGQQFKVEKDQRLFVHRLEAEEGKNVSFDKVLLIDSGEKVSIGDPVVKGASVSAKVISHMKGDKVLVFKKKRRKGYQKLNGHRQYMTQIQIEGILEKGSAAKKESTAAVKEEAPVSKTAVEKKPAAKATTAKTATKTTAKTTAKTTTKKQPVAKKPAAKTSPKKESGKK